MKASLMHGWTPLIVAALVAPLHTQPEFKTADDLLTALETADRGLQNLVADVKYDRTYEITGETEVRMGRLWFVSEQTGEELPIRKFAVKFDKAMVGRAIREEDRTYVFDGQWLAEKDGETKFAHRKQVVGPGEHFDPLRIGQGPFALPIGQRKADITGRYDVELLPAEAGLEPGKDANEEEVAAAGMAKAVAAGSWQLKLSPKVKVEDEDFSEVRLWYTRGAGGELLPRMARTVTTEGVSTVLLSNVEVQLAGKPDNPSAKVSPDILNVKAPEGWDERIDEWRKPAAK